MVRIIICLALVISLTGCSRDEAFEPVPPPSPDGSMVKEKQPEPADPKPVEAKPADPKPTEVKPADPKPTEAKPADPKPAAADSAPTAMKPNPDADITLEVVTYTHGDTTFRGAFAYDAKREGKLPGVVVVHEWWGHNDYVRDRAKMLAEQGYLAFAVDMYGDGRVAKTAKDALAAMLKATKDMDQLAARFQAGYDLLKKHPRFDDGNGKVAAVGYCFGGAVVLHATRIGVPFAGVATFHGSLDTKTPAKPGTINTEILVAHGEADPLVPAATVEAFKQEMKDAGVPVQFNSYPGVKHGFTNPDATTNGERFDIPLAYDEVADKDSWKELMAFLPRVFAKK